jgi:hypothetical protein
VRDSPENHHPLRFVSGAPVIINNDDEDDHTLFEVLLYHLPSHISTPRKLQIPSSNTTKALDLRSKKVSSLVD